MTGGQFLTRAAASSQQPDNAHPKPTRWGSTMVVGHVGADQPSAVAPPAPPGSAHRAGRLTHRGAAPQIGARDGPSEPWSSAAALLQVTDAGPIGNLSHAERFHGLAAPLSTVIQAGPEHCGWCTDPQAASRVSSSAPCCSSRRPDSGYLRPDVEATALPLEHLPTRQLSHLDIRSPSRVPDSCLLESPYLSAPVRRVESGQLAAKACTSVSCRRMRRWASSGVVTLNPHCS